MNKRVVAVIVIAVVVLAVFLIIKLTAVNKEDEIAGQFFSCVKANCLGRFTDNTAFVNCIDTSCSSSVQAYAQIDVNKLSQKYKTTLACLGACSVTEGNLGPCTPACLKDF